MSYVLKILREVFLGGQELINPSWGTVKNCDRQEGSHP